MSERRYDEYKRPIYRDSEIPPADVTFALWRGLVTHPDAVVTNTLDHARICTSGWIRSGNWWLHCGICRPEKRA